MMLNNSGCKNEMMFVVEKNKPYCGSVQSSISDGVHVDFSGGLTLEEYCKKEGKEFESISWSELQDRIKAFQQTLVSEPKEIEEDTYIEMMEVMPPCRYHMQNGIVMFHMSERYTGTIVTWCASVKGKKFFSFKDHDFVDRQYLHHKILKAIQ